MEAEPEPETTMGAEPEDAEASVPNLMEDLPVFSLPLLQTIKTAQRANGLLHSEYERYRHYCTRKVQRVRRALKFTHGRGKYHKRDLVAETLKDEKFLLLPLFYAERAWAYAQQAKQEISTRVERGEPAYRRHSIVLLQKADKWAQHLQQLCEKRGDGTTALESEAYGSWMHGNVLLERDQWKEAKEAFQRAQSIYKELSKVTSGGAKDLFDRRLEEMQPIIRFCDHELKLSAGGDATVDDTAEFVDMQKVEGMDENLRRRLEGVSQDSLRRQAESMSEVEFCGRRIPMTSEKLRVSMLQAEEAKSELHKQTDYDQLMEAFDKVFFVYNDASQLVSDEMKALGQKKSRSETEVGDMKSLELYINAQKMEHTIARNQAMADRLETQLAEHAPNVKPDDLVRLYTMLVQNSEDMMAMYDDQECKEAKQLNANGFVFKAFRCAHLAGKLNCDGKHPEAVAMYDRADGLSRLTIAHLGECETDQSKYKDAVIALQLKMRGAKCAVQAKAWLEANSSAKAEAATGISESCLLDRLDEWAVIKPGEVAKLVDFPPSVQPVPCKPVVYDLAYNYIEMPDLSHRYQKQQSEGMLGKARGLLGKLWG
eukprot:TRINITY_DN19580_c0_g1_i5.p1 TRINITY_DN19580_c0_g1~~TRINITY_DN19580_c0_g1_i5.p1  ORF type:complete len:598 (+),score=159.64 TRINITY_DN19580_c0_g1_i5:202-1995(+)